ncbi:MAG: ATPase with chaperone, ATP-binding subunit [Candidatus Nomurabacteria bacterium]|nr:ATPase with chaperone, ATP-binding subunit [Candidatus Nomurabacteria bacterium]
MAKKLCDICNIRPAEVRVTAIVNGRQQTLDLCKIDYERIRREQGARSPFESLFGKNPFADFDDMFGSVEEAIPERNRKIGRNQEAINIENYLSNQTKEVIQSSAERALSLHAREIDTEHILYALIQNPTTEEIFKQLKLDTGDIKKYLDKNSPSSPKGEAVSPDKMGVSPRVKKILENAFQASRELGHGYIGPEHLLIGLLEEDDGIGGDLLRRYGVTPEKLRQKIVKVVGKGAEEGRIETESKTPTLDKYSRDLSVLAREGKLDPVIGRTDEIETTIEILSRRTKNNPVLIGGPGVGKTAIVEGLAQRIVNEDIPETLLNKRVVELNLNAIVAGSKYRGEFEERVKQVIDEIKENKDELIIFVDELHTMVSAGNQEGGMDMSNVLKPELARGTLHLIGATTLNEYQKYIEKDAALERRFQPILIPEPTVEQTVQILRGLRDKYEAYHKVKISDEAIVTAAALSDRYITNRFLPDKAIDLIDQAASRVRIAASSHSKELRDIDTKLKKLHRERESSKAHNDFKESEKLENEISGLTKERGEEENKWKQKKGTQSSIVTKKEIAEVVSKLTGIPVTDLSKEEKDKLLNLEQKLHERIIGQEEAIVAVSNSVRRSRSGIGRTNRPVASFLFLGPTGVGKTELAKTIAWATFGDEDAIVRIDMSEYMERFSVSRLIGAPPGYVGYEEGGQLTEPIRKRPYSVILLDEIEKAHPDVYNILLQVFDEGRLTDGKGRVVNFTNTIIIATSNMGSEMLEEFQKGKDKSKKQFDEVKQKIIQSLKMRFRPEFLNRLDDIVVFHPLTMEQTRQILLLQLERVKRMAHAQNISISFDESAIGYLLGKGYSEEYGAREINRTIQNEVENLLASDVLRGNLKEGDKVKARFDIKSKSIVFEKEKSPLHRSTLKRGPAKSPQGVR